MRWMPMIFVKNLKLPWSKSQKNDPEAVAVWTDFFFSPGSNEDAYIELRNGFLAPFRRLTAFWSPCADSLRNTWERNNKIILRSHSASIARWLFVVPKYFYKNFFAVRNIFRFSPWGNNGGRAKQKKKQTRHCSGWKHQWPKSHNTHPACSTRLPALAVAKYLRISALGKTVYQIEELKPVLHELKGIDRNLNQLTLLAHQGVIRTVNLTATADGIGRCYAETCQRLRRICSGIPWRSAPAGNRSGIAGKKTEVWLPKLKLRQPDLRLGKMMWRAPSCLFYDYEISDRSSNSTTGILMSSFSININI